MDIYLENIPLIHASPTLTPKEIQSEIALLKDVRDGVVQRKHVDPAIIRFRIRQLYTEYERQLGLNTNSCRMALRKITK